MGRARAEGGRKERGGGAAPRAGARAATSATNGRRRLRGGAEHASAAAALNVSRGAAWRERMVGSSRTLLRKGDVSAQSRWRGARDAGGSVLDMSASSAHAEGLRAPKYGDGIGGLRCCEPQNIAGACCGVSGRSGQRGCHLGLTGCRDCETGTRFQGQDLGVLLVWELLQP
jgi:hypothetical protein